MFTLVKKSINKHEQCMAKMFNLKFGVVLVLLFSLEKI